MGINVTYSRNELYWTNAVWVDLVYGDDTEGSVDRKDKPFKTINAAWTAVNARPNGNYSIYISAGTYTVTTLELNANKNYRVLCQDRRTIVNNSGVLFNAADTIGTLDRLEIFGGEWTRTSGTGTMFQDAGAHTNREWHIKGANISDLTGSAIFQARAYTIIDDCRLVSTLGNVFLGGQAITSTRLIRDSYIEASANDVFSPGTNIGYDFVSSYVRSFTGKILSGGGMKIGMHDGLFMAFDVVIDAAPLELNAPGKNLIRTESLTYAIVINTNSSAVLPLLIIDSLTISQPLGISEVTPTVPACIFNDTSNSPSTRYNRPITLAVVNSLTYTKGCAPNVSVNSPSGAIGIGFNTSTIGNQITLNLPNQYGASPIVFNVTSSSIPQTLLDFKAAIEAQVLTPGTPWADWCRGDVNNVVQDGISVLRVFGAPGIPVGFSIKRSGANIYASETGTDLTNMTNVAPSFVERLGGEIRELDDNPLVYTGATPLSASAVPTPTYRVI